MWIFLLAIGQEMTDPGDIMSFLGLPQIIWVIVKCFLCMSRDCMDQLLEGREGCPSGVERIRAWQLFL